jgi:hypothetical protein
MFIASDANMLTPNDAQQKACSLPPSVPEDRAQLAWRSTDALLGSLSGAPEGQQLSFTAGDLIQVGLGSRKLPVCAPECCLAGLPTPSDLRSTEQLLQPCRLNSPRVAVPGPDQQPGHDLLAAFPHLIDGLVVC